MDPIPPKVAAALVTAQMNSTKVEKDKTNQHHKYDYASAEAIITAARGPLNDAGLAVIPRGVELRESVPGMDERVTARISFGIVHKDGEQVVGDPYDQPIVPDRGRPTDKAVASARTTALGYFLRDLLQLPRVDTEVDQRDDRSYTPGVRDARSEPERLAAEPGPGVDAKEELRAIAETMVKTIGKNRTQELWTKHELPEPKTWAALEDAKAIVGAAKAKQVLDGVLKEIAK